MKVFISYATEDYDTARRVYDDLKAAGVEPWLDREDLLPGGKWKYAIRKAIRESDYFLTLLSGRAVSKRGFVQKEQKLAMEVADEMPEADIFILPVRLDNCEIPMSLEEIQWVDLFPSYEKGMSKIIQLVSRSGMT